ncbi:hypothetical protein [Sciscionella sediminilitoris]|uniref:hypothetical protein n=1 Tax=Sciscionella sediminilitoris TaxID=1445613 RepID=UPI0004DF5512|nr:hypothetical protein [Sciscionella sp. SE31]
MDNAAEQANPVPGEAEAGPGTVLNATPALTAAEFAERFNGYAQAARATAMQAKAKSDAYGEQLANARADVYEKAAGMVGRLPLDQAATDMMSIAGKTHVRKAPLMDFDSSGLQYIASRAWQYCALTIDPNLPEQAPAWE